MKCGAFDGVHPGRASVWASIDAALNPNSTDYYYYALGTDGKHHFSTTLAEHNAFVNSSSYGG